MFIISKEIIKEIINLHNYYENSIENSESSYVLALSVLLFHLAIPMIILVLSAFVLDIILSPLETIIVKKKRNYKEKSVKEFQPTYKLNRKDSRKFKEWECMYERNK